MRPLRLTTPTWPRRRMPGRSSWAGTGWLRHCRAGRSTAAVRVCRRTPGRARAAILADVRRRFGGQVLWAADYPGGLQSLPAFANTLDGVYLLWNAPLTGSSVGDLTASAGQMLDDEIQPLQEIPGQTGHPGGGLSVGERRRLRLRCRSRRSSSRAEPRLGWTCRPRRISTRRCAAPSTNASWLGGFVSRGYYPPAALQDGSASVHGKPAEDVLWYWFGRFTGAVE